jgi:predicted nucleic acid-binding protein
MARTRIYFDTSCLNRPFDDQKQLRIYLETESIIYVMSQIDNGKWSEVTSTMVDIEINARTDEEQRLRVMLSRNKSSDVVPLTEDIFDRANNLIKIGFKPADAVHLAAAEAGHASVLLTTDDRFLRTGARHRQKLRVQIFNPIDWAREHETDENIK